MRPQRDDPVGARRGQAVRRLAAIVVSCLVVLTAGALPAASLVSEETYPRPADGLYLLSGRGYGHAIGLSQYGAKGRAEAGHTWQQIVSAYYPGTTTTAQGNPLIRVKLMSRTRLAVLPASGLRFNPDRAGAGAWQTLPVTVTSGATVTPAEWDIAYDAQAPGWWLRYRASGATAFVRYLKVGATALTVAFDNPTSGLVQFSGSASASYRGELRHVRSADTSAATVSVIDALPMESYLRAVVPSEMPASWSSNALRSQAVVARTYAAFERASAPTGRAYDICDTTACQVMGSVSSERAATDTAIAATAGAIVTYAGAPAFTQFSASNGGYSRAGTKPYLIAQPDPYDGYTWSATVGADTIARTWPAVGTLRSVVVVERDGRGAWGGRVVSMRLDGTAGSVSVTGPSFTSALGLRSSLFVPTTARRSSPSFPRDVTGDGKADVVAIVSSTGALMVYPGNGTGGFLSARTASASTWNVPRAVFSAGAWDVGTTRDLMAVTSTGDLYAYPGSGAGTWSAGRFIDVDMATTDTFLPTGDFDGDGATDIVTRRTDGTLWLMRGNGQGDVLGLREIGNGWDGFTALISPGDFTGDGRADLIARTATGDLVLYPGLGTGAFGSSRTIGWGWSGFTSLTSVGDFTGDARSDIMARDVSGLLWLYPGTGTGGFGARRQIGNGWSVLTIVP